MFKLHNELTGYHEVVVLGLFEEETFSANVEEVNCLLSGKLSTLVSSSDILRKMGEITTIHQVEEQGITRYLFVGLGKREKYSTEDIRNSLGKLSKLIQKAKYKEVSILLDSFISDVIDSTTVAHLFAELFQSSTYVYDGYKTKQIEVVPVDTFNIITTNANEEIKKSLQLGQVYGTAVNNARTLVNMPGNKLTSTVMAEYAKELANKYGLECTIVEKEEMEELGMGALLAVNQGSIERPKLIVLKYQGKDTWEDVIGLVGKGITFDTGGYSIKTKLGIVGMKTDMGGAASVLGAMEIIAQTKPKQNVLAIIPSTDNMISGDAFKPDDVITAMNGKTIEVLNTDAEGRLVLADGLTYAKKLGANYLVDIATLTGGVITALGFKTTGAMTNNQDLYNKVVEAAHIEDEYIWQLPLFEHDIKRVRTSPVADLNNSPGSDGHAIVAGAFIGEFAEGTPWVHLDIAGTSAQKSATNLGPAGATGVMVRTLATFVQEF